VNIESPQVYVPDIKPSQTEKDVLTKHYAELAIQPMAGGPVYHLAANPVPGVRYDAIVKQGKEDTAWNGTWNFTYEGGKDHSRYYSSTYSASWTGLFTIPFSTLGVSAPASGAAWGFNAGWQNPAGMIWSNGNSVVAAQSLGKLMF
jgi:hypothetical protein